MLWICLAVTAYFVPTVIAMHRDRLNTGWIALLNLFLGWTVVGWFALIWWAISNPDPQGWAIDSRGVAYPPGERRLWRRLTHWLRPKR